jgi:hypothetical protein
VTTVRSNEKAQLIKDAFPGHPESQLDFVIVKDVAMPGAFDKAVISEPPFEAVIHTASPFTFAIKDIQKVWSEAIPITRDFLPISLHRNFLTQQSREQLAS